jgi:branched-chain amino acid transport system ATP-binding protein
MAEVPLLSIENLDAYYGPFRALFGVSLRVEGGETISVIGANSAGKTTLMKSILGMVRTGAGAIHFKGAPLLGLETHVIARLGISMSPAGRRLFPSLTVEENLLAGGQSKRKGIWSLARVYSMFPALEERRRQPATLLSGGQQQMTAIGRALMSNPDLILIDELSLGLAPIVIKDIYSALPRITEAGTSAIIVEQDTAQALAASGRVYCLRGGRVVLQGKPADLTRDSISAAYFGA